MIRKKKQQYKDYMSDLMDKELERLEGDIASLYSNVSKGLLIEFTEFTDTFAEEDAKYRVMVANGQMTQEEYQLWLQRKTVQNEMYKATIDSMADTLVRADQLAMAMINGTLPVVVAQSYNFVQSLGFAAADKAGLSVGTFQVYNARTVQAIMNGKDVLKPKVDIPEDLKWNKDKLNKAVNTSIIKGESMDDAAKRLQQVANMDNNAAIRNARTAITSAENLGRTEASDFIRKQGVPIDDVWHCIYDSRTRDSHLLLDGTTRDKFGYFGADFLNTPLRYPADPMGDPEEIYNCRCRVSIELEGIDHSKDEELYEEFMKTNYPNDWKNLQENQHYQDKKREEIATKDYQKALKEIKEKGYMEV
jgi:hypothetical protein